MSRRKGDKSQYGYKNPLAYAIGRYKDKQGSAKKYNIPFNLTFEDYYQLFLDAGVDKNIPQKNNGQAKCLCRYNDIGPYSVDNCYIATASQNHIDAHENKTFGFKISKNRCNG